MVGQQMSLANFFLSVQNSKVEAVNLLLSDNCKRAFLRYPERVRKNEKKHNRMPVLYF